MNIFIHRRDLRIEDNTTLLHMYKNLENIIPIFIFNPLQINPLTNKYFSNNLVNFMCDSLNLLSNDYQKKNMILHFYEGDIIDILNEIHSKYHIDNIGFNIDYSPFSQNRDKQIIEWGSSHKINIITQEDMLLIDINSKKGLKKSDNKPYTVFTPFMKNLLNYNVRDVNKKKIKGTQINISNKYSIENLTKFYKQNKSLHVPGGRKYAKNILKHIQKQDNYNDNRNLLTYQTSNLSAYINLGLISIREVYHSIKNILGINSGLITELYWRDFYYNILYHFPHVVGSCFKEKYNQLEWDNNIEYFDKWKNGQTGFPIVDACMNQLNTTGYMHNRGRMIVSSFLTKDLLIDWKWGEKYFATQLIDYNISANNGGWQWASGTGTDAQPYFRIFNPWTQSKNFDPDCIYIKKWIPELKNVESKHIHQWDKYHSKYDNIYLQPIIQHDIARKKTLDIYKKI